MSSESCPKDFQVGFPTYRQGSGRCLDCPYIGRPLLVDLQHGILICSHGYQGYITKPCTWDENKKQPNMGPHWWMANRWRAMSPLVQGYPPGPTTCPQCTKDCNSMSLHMVLASFGHSHPTQQRQQSLGLCWMGLHILLFHPDPMNLWAYQGENAVIDILACQFSI